MIKVIDKLYLRDGIGCSIHNRKYYSAHLKQGDLDGACAVYSLMMYLLILNVVTRRQLEDSYGNLRKTDPINSLFKALFDNKGLIRNGFFYTKLQPIINRHISEIVTAKAHENLENYDILNSIKDYIDNENPIMISVQYSGGAHAMLAVGYEANDDDIVNIFCLDPAYDCSPTSYWNAVIALNENQSKKYPHKWITNNPINFLSIDSSNSRNVWLGEILCIEKK